MLTHVRYSMWPHTSTESVVYVVNSHDRQASGLSATTFHYSLRLKPCSGTGWINAADKKVPGAARRLNLQTSGKADQWVCNLAVANGKRTRLLCCRISWQKSTLTISNHDPWQHPDGCQQTLKLVCPSTGWICRVLHDSLPTIQLRCYYTKADVLLTRLKLNSNTVGLWIITN